MRPLMVGLSALGLLVAEAGAASAAWDNVFQTTFFGLFRRQTTTNCCPAPVVAQSIPVVAATPACTSCASPAPAPCAQPSCSTSYVQRCYYQPVTTYQTQSYYEPVTTYRTSYYYEPVTSYRYSCYYDPCSCSYQQVATPVTAYQLRAQSCPVQSWVQRCASVPVTSYQQSCYWQPVTTCCQTTVGAMIPASAPVVTQAAVVQQPVVQQPPVMQQPAVQPPPSVIENRQPPMTPPPPQINEQKQYYPPSNGKQTNFLPNTPPPPVKLDRIVVGPDATVDGQVVRSDNTPRANARVQFVSADRLAPSQTVVANSAGRFHVTLAPGGWLVYLDAPDGTQLYHSRIEVTPEQTAPRITLVNR